MELIVLFIIEHPTNMITELPPTHNKINELHQVKEFIQEAIGVINSAHIVQEMVDMHTKWSNQVKPTKKTLTLHRRVFFDESRENLLIILA